MSCLVAGLPKTKDQRGSRARCILLTHGARAEIASRLNSLVAPYGAVDPGRRVWAPGGFDAIEEAKLGETAPFLCADHQEKVTAWWLAVRRMANTPNWDILSQVEIDGREGLLLVEAKAHEAELCVAGKSLQHDASDNSRSNHRRIGQCIEASSTTLKQATGLDWRLSRDKHYQMSNRFAWAAKVAELGIPVVLVYLGFLNAKEMEDCGRPLADAGDWEKLVRGHSAPLFQPEVWNRPWDIGGTPLIPLIRCIDLPLQCPNCPDGCAIAGNGPFV